MKSRFVLGSVVLISILGYALLDIRANQKENESVLFGNWNCYAMGITPMKMQFLNSGNELAVRSLSGSVTHTNYQIKEDRILLSTGDVLTISGDTILFPMLMPFYQTVNCKCLKEVN